MSDSTHNWTPGEVEQLTRSLAHLREENERLRQPLLAIRERFTVDVGEGRHFCWACRLYSDDVDFHTWHGPAKFAPACAMAGRALGGWKKQDQPEAERRIAEMRAKGHKPPTDDEAQSTLDATLRALELDDGDSQGKDEP